MNVCLQSLVFPFKTLISLLLMTCATLISGCSGESQPFLEAIEIRELRLVSLTPLPPDGFVSLNDTLQITQNTTISPGESIALRLNGQTDTGTTVVLSTTERDWRSSDDSVLTVDRDGRVTGRANGVADVAVSIGGVESARLNITVSDAELVAVQRLIGEDRIERCLPQNYRAVGTYSDGSSRPLPDVFWSLQNSDSAALDVVSGVAAVTANAAGVVTLTAAAGVLFSELEVTVLDTLTELVIAPNPAAVDVDNTLILSAIGVYQSMDSMAADPDNGQREDNITQSVQWSVVSGTTAFASVNNTDDKGVVTGVQEGTAAIRAACGDVSGERLVVINDPANSISLSFDRSLPDQTLELLDGQSEQLRVAEGSRYDADKDVTDEAEWSVENAGNATNPINLADVQNGLIRAINPGTVVVTVSFNGASRSFIVRVL